MRRLKGQEIIQDREPVLGRAFPGKDRIRTFGESAPDLVGKLSESLPPVIATSKSVAMIRIVARHAIAGLVHVNSVHMVLIHYSVTQR